MKQFSKLLYILLFIFSSLYANKIELIEPESAIKTIGKKRVQFILAEESIEGVVGTKVIDIQSFYGADIVGNMTSEPLYCSLAKMHQYLESLGIKNDTQLIIYDNSYGIYASTLYAVLESLGHKDMKILHGNYLTISKLDKNQYEYDKYQKDFEDIKRLKKIEKNMKMIKYYDEEMEDVNKTLEFLKPLLLIQPIDKSRGRKSKYIIKKNMIVLKYLVDTKGLKKAINLFKLKPEEGNISIVDTCNMIDIVDASVTNVKSIGWKYLVDKKAERLKSKSFIDKFLKTKNLNKENTIYLYCMSSSAKAFYVSLALRRSGYKDVKVFAGNWDVWTGDKFE